MALQTCFPLNIESWIWSVEPQVIEFLPRSINVFWGGVKYPRPPRIDCDYLELVQYNQPHWLIFEPLCVCNKLLYASSLYKKDSKRNWIRVEFALIDFDISPGSFHLSQNRYYGNEDYHSPSSPGCGITFPFDTQSTLVSFQQQCSIWEITSGSASGTFSDFYLFDPIIEDTDKIDCSVFDCSGREPGWYVSFVLLDSFQDIRSDSPQLPPSISYE